MNPLVPLTHLVVLGKKSNQDTKYFDINLLFSKIGLNVNMLHTIVRYSSAKYCKFVKTKRTFQLKLNFT